jgi:hypothetical protein
MTLSVPLKHHRLHHKRSVGHLAPTLLAVLPLAVY